YTGAGGVMRRGTPEEIATQESYNTRFGVQRVARYAFEQAMARSRKKLTLVHKTNVLTYAGDLWQRTVDSLAKEYPEVSVDYQHVDAASMFFVTQPERFDVIVTDNLFGDILTDLGAAIAGGIGLAASGNINPARRYPSMFEPVHGSAPDIAGQSKADPTAAILSAALLCSHLGLPGASAKIEQAVADDLIERQGEWAARTTVEIGEDIAERGSGYRGASPRLAPHSVTHRTYPVPARKDRSAMTASPDTAIDFEIHPSQARVPAAERERVLAAPGFGQAFTDHMITLRWSTERGWHD